MNRTRWAIIIVFLLLIGLDAGLVYYFRKLLPFWAQVSLIGALVVGGVLLFALAKSDRMEAEAPVKEASPSPPSEEAPPAPEVASCPEPPAPDPEAYVAALVAVLQREGRLLDFLNENLDAYDDAQIGAAVRTIHRGLRTALFDLLELAPVIQAKEGAEVVVEEGFDPKEIRLVGNVKGRPPFRGVLRHRGWRLVRFKLPKPKKDKILAPAEVEIP